MTFAGAVSKEVASKNNSLNIVGMVRSDYFLLALPYLFDYKPSNFYTN